MEADLVVSRSPGGQVEAMIQEPWAAKLLELAQDLIQHGHGDLTFSSTMIAGDRCKIVIRAGREYVFIIKRPLTAAPPAP